MSSSIEETRAAVPSDAVYNVVRHGVKATKWIDWNAWYHESRRRQVTLQPPWAAILDRRVSSKSRVALNSHAEISCIFFLSLVETHTYSSDPLGFSFFLYIKYTYKIFIYQIQ
jgi:hypothetical protein